MAENRALIPEPNAMYTQTEKMKDAKDLSKNLVSGDFERQFRAGVVEKPGRWRNALTLVGVAIGALACWLLVLTLVREAQIGRLRNEVEGLMANVVALEANVKSLNQRLSMNEFTDDALIYADEKEDASPDEDQEPKKDWDLVKLQKLTQVVPGDTSMPDDEDMYEDDDDDDDADAESGDYYMDYNNRGNNNGVSSMVHLKPDDFNSFVTLGKTQQSELKELSRQINEDPENPNIGVPAFTGSTESKESRHKRSVFPDSSSEDTDHFEAPKSISKDEERRKTKKFVPNSAGGPMNKMALHSVTRTVRSDGEGATRRPFIAAHFHGNTSLLNPETHAHYKGNGLLRVAHDKPHDVWYPSPWTIASPHPRPTLTRNGHIHVHHTGVYLVYVQIYYLDSHDIISWVLHRTNAEIEGRETLMQCAQSAHTPEPMDKPNSCFSASALFLKAGDRLAVRNTGGDRHSLMQPEKSFIGLIKLADADDPNDDEF